MFPDRTIKKRRKSQEVFFFSQIQRIQLRWIKD
jgi:hypothetical protein